jgi:hypothetical protein
VETTLPGAGTTILVEFPVAAVRARVEAQSALLR